MVEKRRVAAVVLAGCGAMDGAEISEAVLALYALSCNGVEYKIYAPDIMQHHVVNHYKKEVEEGAERNVLHEAARIARGDISPLADMNVSEYDMVIFAGGYGGAKNLSSFAFDGGAMSVEPSVERVMVEAHKSSTPIGAMCIMPVVLSCALKGSGVVVATCEDSATGELIAGEFGAEVVDCPANGATVDMENRVSTTPAFMYSANTLASIGEGADKMVKALLCMLS